MAKFLNTTGISYHLEELIKATSDRLILISPYLQFHSRIKDHIHNLHIQKKDIRIVYRESKLKPEENNWLESQIGIRTSIISSLHAKCYLNEKEAIVTSMNLYSFSQQNNDEMGILVTKDDDPTLYDDIFKEAMRLLTISEEIRVSVKKIHSNSDLRTPEKPAGSHKGHDNSKLYATKDISLKTGVSSRNINLFLQKNKLMYKKGEDWLSTNQGKQFGGIEKEGPYGKFVVWPEKIIKLIQHDK